MQQQNSQHIKPQTAVVKKSRQISMVWFIPILAVILGGWLVYKNKHDKGPLITISFKSATGLEVGKTKIRYKDVQIGLVEEIEISPDLESVIVTARMQKETRSYINKNTKFWIVKPRVGVGSVTGLGTLLSGAYIGIDTVKEGEPVEEFIGLEQPPLRTGRIPGVKVILLAESSASLTIGSPVYYKSFKAGTIERIELNEELSRVRMEAFIEIPYARLVTSNTNFWNVSGISAEISADGVSVNMQSLETLILGGITFDTPARSSSDKAVADGATFPLYKNAIAAGTRSYLKKLYFILNFDQSIRGLNVGAPVEYKGLKIGRVVSIQSQYNEQSEEIYIPILIEIEPERLGIKTDVSKLQPDKDLFKGLIEEGFRAKLQSGSLLTGQLFVSVEFYPDAEKVSAEYFGGHPEIPTLPTDLDKIKHDVIQVLEKVNTLEVEKVIDNLNLTVTELRALVNNTDTKITNVLNNLDRTLNDSRKLIKGLDEESVSRYQLDELMKEIRQAARSVKILAETIEKKPNSLLFGTGVEDAN